MTTPTIERRCHWLRRNRASKRPDLLLFVDTEAHLTAIREGAEQHTLRLGWACLCRYVPRDGLKVIGWQEISDPVEFWHTVSSLAVGEKTVYVVAHNLEYDARLLRAFSILPGIGWSPAYAILGNSCKFFTFTADKHTIALLDNMNYWQCSLADIGHELGIEKGKVDFKTCSDDELSQYCKRDVEILVKAWDFWLRLLDDHDLGDFAITIAGQAFRAFRHRFMSHKIGIHNNKQAIDLERASYRGGRCEVFKVGKFNQGPYYKLDINGLYAYCMQAYEYPLKLVKTLVNVTPDELGRLLDTYIATADVYLETEEPYYAVRSRGLNVFPVGQFRATLTTWEVQNALEKGHLRGIGPVAIYEKAPLFKEYIDYLTPLRQRYKEQGDPARSQLCKMLRNALYGKFGQKGYKQEVIDTAPLDVVKVRRWIDYDTGRECSDWTYGGVVIRQEAGGEGQDSFPAIASHIAAAGRCVLWDYIQKAGQQNCYYADTDSLIVNTAGYQALQPWIDPLELGCLKIEGISDDLEILAKKEYVFGGKSVLKGIKANATRTPDNGWKQTHFTSIKWGFSHGTLDDIITYDVTKHCTSAFAHGKIGPGGIVIPPRFGLKREDVIETVRPIDPTRWDWWVDLDWVSSLPRKSHPVFLPRWFRLALLAPEAAPLAF